MNIVKFKVLQELKQSQSCLLNFTLLIEKIESNWINGHALMNESQISTSRIAREVGIIATKNHPKKSNEGVEKIVVVGLTSGITTDKVSRTRNFSTCSKRTTRISESMLIRD